MDNWKVFICVILRPIWDNCEIGSPGPPLFRPGYNLVNVIVFFNFATRRRKFRFYYLASSSEECPLAAGTCSGATELLAALEHLVGTLSPSQASRALATNLHPFLIRVPPPCLLATVSQPRLAKPAMETLHPVPCVLSKPGSAPPERIFHLDSGYRVSVLVHLQ